MVSIPYQSIFFINFYLLHIARMMNVMQTEAFIHVTQDLQQLH